MAHSPTPPYNEHGAVPLDLVHFGAFAEEDAAVEWDWGGGKRVRTRSHENERALGSEQGLRARPRT